MFGMWLGHALPQRHLDSETKDLVKLGVGLIGTMAALLLGLLVASAKSAYDARSNELTQMAANTVLLDRALMHYGPAAAPTRAVLKIAIARIIDQVWGNQSTDDGALLPASQPLGIVFDKIQELETHSDAQRAIQSQAESVVVNLGQERLLLFAQSGSSISTPFLGSSGLLAHRAVRELRVIRAAQPDGNRYTVRRRNISRWRLISNP